MPLRYISITEDDFLADSEFLADFMGENITKIFEIYEKSYVVKGHKEKIFKETQSLVLQFDDEFVAFYCIYWEKNLKKFNDREFKLFIVTCDKVIEQESNKEFSCCGGYDYYSDGVKEVDFFDNYENYLTDFGYIYPTNSTAQGENQLQGFYIEVNGYQKLYVLFEETPFEPKGLNGYQLVLSAEKPHKCYMCSVGDTNKEQ